MTRSFAKRPSMKELLTPKQVAQAIQVSESSVKRWCDKGVIPTRYTAGGHRRIPLGGLMDFLKAKNFAIVEPELLGLPPVRAATPQTVGQAAVLLSEALLRGDEQQCRQIIVDLYLAEHSVASLCDQVMGQAFHMIGDRWECGEAEVYQERRGCEIALRVLHEIRRYLPVPDREAPIAIGGSPEGDLYKLSTTMAELVLRDAGWRATSLGNNLPFRTLAAAIEEHHPRILWLSCSHIEHPSRFADSYSELYDNYGMDVAFVLGGRALTDLLRKRIKYAAYCDTMQHLESCAQALLANT